MVNDDEEIARRREQAQELTARLLIDVSRETGLKVSTIRDLMDRGWLYRKNFREPDTFVKIL